MPPMPSQKKGNIKKTPLAIISVPPIVTAQKMSFCPALNFSAGGLSPRVSLRKPPPRFSQTQSIPLGMFRPIHMTIIARRPSAKTTVKAVWV